MIIILLLYVLVFLVSYILYRRGISPDITRKIVHIGAGIITAYLPVVADYETIVFFGSLTSIIVFASKKLKILDSIHDSTNPSIGSILFAPSLTLVAIISLPSSTVAFQASTLILAIADGFSGLIGGRFGQTGYSITGRKTFVGSVTFFVIAFFILNSFVNLPLNLSLPMTLFLTAVEASASRGYDNFLVPISSSICLYLVL